MGETRYMISDMAKKVDVEAHVLRYWEEELEIGISRTELGHRYYTEEDVSLFLKIKELKERGLQLKAIKVLIPRLEKKKEACEEREEVPEEPVILSEEKKDGGTPTETLPAIGPDPDKLKQFENIVTGIFRQVIQDNNAELECRITDSVAKEMNLLMQMREEKEEERFRRLDETIRTYQKNRQLVAAAKEPELKKKKWFGLFAQQAGRRGV